MGRFAFVPMTCSRSGRFLMTRFEWNGYGWSLVGASFARRPTSSPGFPGEEVQGSFELSSDYQGCPGCHADGFVRCGRCAELGCYDTSWPQFQCASCGNSGEVSGTIANLRTSSDR